MTATDKTILGALVHDEGDEYAADYRADTCLGEVRVHYIHKEVGPGQWVWNMLVASPTIVLGMKMFETSAEAIEHADRVLSEIVKRARAWDPPAPGTKP